MKSSIIDCIGLDIWWSKTMTLGHHYYNAIALPGPQVKEANHFFALKCITDKNYK